MWDPPMYHMVVSMSWFARWKHPLCNKYLYIQLSMWQTTIFVTNMYAMSTCSGKLLLRLKLVLQVLYLYWTWIIPRHASTIGSYLFCLKERAKSLESDSLPCLCICVYWETDSLSCLWIHIAIRVRVMFCNAYTSFSSIYMKSVHSIFEKHFLSLPIFS